jgi:hypothetical protein
MEHHMSEHKPGIFRAAHEFAIACEAVQDVLGIPKDDIAQLAQPVDDDWKLHVHLNDGTTSTFELTADQRRALTSYGIGRLLH